MYDIDSKVVEVDGVFIQVLDEAKPSMKEHLGENDRSSVMLVGGKICLRMVKHGIGHEIMKDLGGYRPVEVFYPSVDFAERIGKQLVAAARYARMQEVTRPLDDED